MSSNRPDSLPSTWSRGQTTTGHPRIRLPGLSRALDGNGAEMGPADLRELARRLRDHAAAVEDVACELDQWRAAEPVMGARPRVPPGNHLG